MSNMKIIRLSSNPDGFGQTQDVLQQEMFDSPLPIQNSYEYYADYNIGIYVGVWDTTDMIEAAAAYPCDEFMWLLEGEAVIKNNNSGKLEKARAGEAFIIPRGYNCQWHQTGYLRKYYFISENPDDPVPDKPSVTAIVIPDTDFKTQPIGISEPFLLINEVKQKVINCYQDTTNKFFSGIWECEAFQAKARPFPYNQLSIVMEGSVILTDEKKQQHLFKTGEAFFIPEGVYCSGHSTEKVRLCYAIVSPLSRP
ncbi:MAG: DUF861 domain-containing protein [Gammaproteobacteria bacterium]|nr:DUF861 domain-containing protein [Gammaproteobacteria bacterium]